MTTTRLIAAGRRQRGLILGLLLLGSLTACQWCPTPPPEQGGGQAPASPGGPRQGEGTTAATDRSGDQRSLQQAERGHRAMVRCLQSERALTDGNELRCEDWRVVRDEFLRP